MSNKQSGRGSFLWVYLLWFVGASDVISVWALRPLAGVYWPGVSLRGVCVYNERSGRGSSLWVCLLWSVGASDVVSVWAWVIVSAAAPCRCLLARRMSLRGVCV